MQEQSLGAKQKGAINQQPKFGILLFLWLLGTVINGLFLVYGSYVVQTNMSPIFRQTGFLIIISVLLFCLARLSERYLFLVEKDSSTSWSTFSLAFQSFFFSIACLIASLLTLFKLIQLLFFL
jgi:hypothetical protein